MALENWLPIGFDLPSGGKCRTALFEGSHWQIVETEGGGRALVADDFLARRWMDVGLIEGGTLRSFNFGDRQLWAISCSPSHTLSPVNGSRSPRDKSEALAFAIALRATRAIDADSALQDALYVERITRLLPTYSITSRVDDAVVLGYWLTGGMSVPATSFRRLRQVLSWMDATQLSDVVHAAGFQVAEVVLGDMDSSATRASSISTHHLDERSVDEPEPTDTESPRAFELAGRPALAAFFNEHVVDLVRNRERYRALGIGFPSGVVLHGLPGTGKTFAVDALIEYLGWPSFRVDAGTVASPYIHETSRKVAHIFTQAIDSSPSVLVIDEMEAFLADREREGGQHRIEEIAEFLRRIPEAIQNEVLVIAMTNRIDLIDPAILRRGRFDHVIEVGFAGEDEIRELLEKLLSMLPTERDIDTGSIARSLKERPLSDVSFAVREAARLAARTGKDRLDQACLMQAIGTTPVRDRGHESARRRIGFV